MKDFDFGDGNMREIARIDRIIDKIKKKWHNNPDMRFNQLLINLGVSVDIYENWSLEDDIIEKHIDENVNKL